MTEHEVFVILNYLSVIVMLGCTTAIFTHAESRMQKLALVVCACLSVVCIGFLIRIEATTAEALLEGQKLVYAFVTHGMFLMLLFILEYCRFRLPKWLVWVFHGINLLTTLVVLTMEHHSLFYRAVWAVPEENYFILEKEYGPAHTFAVALFAVYMLAALAAAIVFSVKNMRQRSRYVWRVLVAVMVPCLSYVIPKLAGLHNDLQPIAFAVFAVLVLVMIYRNSLYDVENIAVKYAFQSMEEAIIVVDEQKRFKGCNENARRLFPVLSKVYLDVDIHRESSLLADYLEQRVKDFYQNDRVYESAVKSITEGDRVRGYVLCFTDVTMQRSYLDLLRAQKQSLESEVSQLTDISRRDGLTGLYNRRAYEELVQQIRQSGNTANVTVMEADINGLKEVNDTIGHAAGDEIIRGTADILYQVFSGCGKIFRTGGDEFIIICTKYLQDPETMMEQMRSSMQSWQGTLVEHLSFSYGYTTGNEQPGADIDELMQRADERLYDHKRRYYEQIGVDRRKHQEELIYDGKGKM